MKLILIQSHAFYMGTNHSYYSTQRSGLHDHPLVAFIPSASSISFCNRSLSKTWLSGSGTIMFIKTLPWSDLGMLRNVFAD